MGFPADSSFLTDLPYTVTAAHELKSPLALIRQLALSLGSADLNSPESRQLLRQITLTSERALRLTTDLSRALRLEDSLFTLEPIMPSVICEDVAHELTPLYREKGREIRVIATKRPLLMLGNRDLLRRILLNFGDNALHYADPDSPVVLQTHSTNRGETIRLSVRDYGPSVPMDIWRRLSLNLGTSNQALHARPQSSGLGLHVSGQFAAAMQGKIGATRHQDGSTFYVELSASSQIKLL